LKDVQIIDLAAVELIIPRNIGSDGVRTGKSVESGPIVSHWQRSRCSKSSEDACRDGSKVDEVHLESLINDCPVFKRVVERRMSKMKSKQRRLYSLLAVVRYGIISRLLR
jgi:hypothetical protein